MALASSWVTPHVLLGSQDFGSSWSVAIDLWRLRARAPLSVRLAIPQFLFRTVDGEIDFHKESTRDDVTQDVLRPGDEGHVRLAERYLIKICGIQDLVAEKKKILASTDAEEKIELQASYDEMFHYHWHEPTWRSIWLKPAATVSAF